MWSHRWDDRINLAPVALVFIECFIIDVTAAVLFDDSLASDPLYTNPVGLNMREHLKIRVIGLKRQDRVSTFQSL